MEPVNEKDFMEVMNKMRKLNAPSRLIDMSHSEFVVCHFIKCRMKDNPQAIGVRVGELGKCIFNSNAAASKMLSSMENKNYIKRVSDPKDKRVTYIQLTDYGRDSFEEAGKTMKGFFDDVMKKMGEHDSRQLLELFNRLCTIFEQELEAKGR